MSSHSQNAKVAAEALADVKEARINHEEALPFAISKRSESNLARCYLDLVQQSNGPSERHVHAQDATNWGHCVHCGQRIEPSAPQQSAGADDGWKRGDPERRKDNWTLIVKEYADKIGTRWKDHDGTVYHFFGIVHGDDDYYYGLQAEEGKVRLSSCVGYLEHSYELLPTSGRCTRCGRNLYADSRCYVIGCTLNEEQPNATDSEG